MNTFDHVKIPPDKQIGRHSQSGYELDYIITGRGIRTLGTVGGPFQEGEVILVPPELSHQWAFDSRNVDENGFIENISFHFSSCFLEKISETFPELSDKMLRLRNLTEAVQYKGKTRESLAQLLSQLDNLETNKRCPAILSLMMELSDFGETERISSISKLRDAEKRLEKIRVYIRCNYSRNITIKEIASYIGMNRTAFCTFYKKERGKTFITELNEYRLETATQLLENHPEMNVSEIASAVGFGTVPHFIRCFAVWKGISPGKWRRQLLSELRKTNLNLKQTDSEKANLGKA